MNAARFARNLIDGGVDAKLAHTLAECLADEIERSVATREQVETIVTREVQQLRVEMHEFRTEMHPELRRSEERVSERLDMFQSQIAQRQDAFQSQMTERQDTFQTQIMQRMDAFQAQVLQRLDSHFRWLITSLIVLFLAMLGNILKDLLP